MEPIHINKCERHPNSELYRGKCYACIKDRMWWWYHRRKEMGIQRILICDGCNKPIHDGLDNMAYMEVGRLQLVDSRGPFITPSTRKIAHVHFKPACIRKITPVKEEQAG